MSENAQARNHNRNTYTVSVSTSIPLNGKMQTLYRGGEGQNGKRMNCPALIMTNSGTGN